MSLMQWKFGQIKNMYKSGKYTLVNHIVTLLSRYIFGLSDTHSCAYCIRGCIYLYEISQIENVRNLLHKKRSGLLCIDALDRYRDTNPDVHKWAEKALVMYART